MPPSHWMPPYHGGPFGRHPAMWLFHYIVNDLCCVSRVYLIYIVYFYIIVKTIYIAEQASDYTSVSHASYVHSQSFFPVDFVFRPH